MTEPRRHHFVPAFYLSHFATPQERHGRMYAYDRMTGKAFPSTPDGLANQRDFYRVDLDDDPEGHDANIVEHTLGKLEALCAPVVAAVNERGVLPTDRMELRVLFAFIASQAARTPRVRANMERFYDRTGKLILQTYARDRTVFEKEFLAVLEEEHGVGNVTQAQLDQAYEDHNRLVESENTHVRMDQTTLVKDALDVMPGIEDMLAMRHWVLCIAPDGTSFVTTDDPVMLRPATRRRMPPLWSPGFGDANSEVWMPIGPRYMLMGLAQPVDRARFRWSRHEVAEANTDMALRAHRFIYSARPTFTHVAESAGAVHIVEGPTDFLRAREPEPSIFDALGP